MANRIVIQDLTDIRTMDAKAQRAICGGVASAFLFRSRPSPIVPSINFNVANMEVNNYEITNYIDQLISQTNNQLQLSQINVDAGDRAAINILSDQGLNGRNTSDVN